MHFTIHHPTNLTAQLWKGIASCRIEGGDPAVQYSIQTPHGVSAQTTLVDQRGRQVALMKTEGFSGHGVRG